MSGARAGGGAGRPLVLAVVGAGPRGTSLVERIAANAAEAAPGRRVEVHVVDPHPPGGGRIWRRRQSPLLWMNTTADDCTLYPDASVACAGPVHGGPTLTQWAARLAEGRLPAPPGFTADPQDIAEARRVHGGWFATRRLQSAYLSWVFYRACAADPRVRVRPHRAGVRDLVGLPDGRQRLVLSGGARPIDADAVLLAQGNVEVDPGLQERRTATEAAARGLDYLPPASTADAPLDRVPAGEPVLVRGLGLAFIDAMVLLTSGRGGTFHRDGAGRLHYRRSGGEPVILAGSRRGVPYHSKIHYGLPGERPRPPRALAADALARLGDGPLDLARDLWPRALHDIAEAAHRELALSHPDRLAMDPERFLARLDEAEPGGPEAQALIARAIPDPADRFDAERIDRPLAGRRFASRAGLQRWAVGYIEADLHRRRDPRYSPDLAVFHALLAVAGILFELVRAGRVAAESADRDMPRFMGFFSFLASGPPGPRLEELLALARAGVVRFLGADTEITVAGDGFRARSASAPGEAAARTLIDARLPELRLERVRDPLLASLKRRGEIRERVPTGLIDADPADQRVRDAAGRPHPARFAAGVLVAGGAGSGGFPRPGTGAPFFSQNDALAREALAAALQVSAGGSGEGGPDAAEPAAEPAELRS